MLVGATAGWLLANLGLAPLFMGLGVYYKSTGLINAATWVPVRPPIWLAFSTAS